MSDVLWWGGYWECGTREHGWGVEGGVGSRWGGRGRGAGRVDIVTGVGT